MVGEQRRRRGVWLLPRESGAKNRCRFLHRKSKGKPAVCEAELPLVARLREHTEPGQCRLSCRRCRGRKPCCQRRGTASAQESEKDTQCRNVRGRAVASWCAEYRGTRKRGGDRHDAAA